MYSTIREVRYIDEDKDEFVFIENVAYPRVPNIGERIVDYNADRDYEEIHYIVRNVETRINRTEGKILYNVFIEKIHQFS